MSEPQPVGSDESDDTQAPAADETPLTTDEESQADDVPVQPGNS